MAYKGKKKLKVCSKCHVSPVVERVMYDGIRQIKCYCPQCGLAFYTPIDGKVDARDCWNSRNKRKTTQVVISHNLVCPDSPYHRPKAYTSDQCAYSDKGSLLSAGEYGTDLIDDFVF